MPERKRLVVVDDHPLIRRGLRDTLNEAGEFVVVGEGSTADDAVHLTKESRPDLVLLDVTMPGDGIRAAELIASECPGVKVAILSVRDDIGTVGAALRAGARGYISKGTGGPDLIATLRRILRGECYVDPDLAARLLADGRGPAPSPFERTVSNETIQLSEREEQIFTMIGKGLSNPEIAEELGLSTNTVKHYITPLLQKLGVRNRVEAALLAREHAITRPIAKR